MELLAASCLLLANITIMSCLPCGIPALPDLLWRIPQGEPCTLSRSRGDSLKAGPPAGLRLLRAYDSGEAVGRPGFAT